MATETVYQRRQRLKRQRSEPVELADNVVELMPEDRQAKPKGERLVPSRRAGTVNRRARINVTTVSKRWATIFECIKRGEYTWQEFCDGLDAEELARGQLRDVDGGFKGRPPKIIPREFFLACQRELHRRFNEKMQTALLEATTMYIDLSKSVDDPAVQERMLRYIIERVMGPVPKEVKVSATEEFQGFLGGVVRTAGVVERKSRYSKRTEEIIDEFEEDFDDER